MVYRVNDVENPDYITVTTAAKRLNISTGNIRNAIHAGRLPAIRSGLGKKQAKFRIKESDFQQFVENLKFIPDKPE